MGLIRARVRVYGRVQGVFFRQNTAHQAELLCISGWVRNCDDGSVEALFEGEEEAVEKILEWCGNGPRAARVEKVDVERTDVERVLVPKKKFGSFEIKH